MPNRLRKTTSYAHLLPASDFLIPPVLAASGVDHAKLPIATIAARQSPDLDLAEAARLAMHSGCVVADLRPRPDGYDLVLQVRKGAYGPKKNPDLWLHASQGTCERQLRRLLRNQGLAPPRQRTMALFARIGL